MANTDTLSLTDPDLIISGISGVKPPKETLESYKPTQQKRSAMSEGKLLAAAETLFAEHGFFGTKVSDIIRQSGCSTGSFYHRFGDKEGLAKVMVARFVDDAHKTVRDMDLSRGTHWDLHTMLRHFARLSFDLMASRFGAYRAAQRLAQTAPETWADTGVLTNVAKDKVLEFLPEYADEIGAADPVAAMTSAVQMIIMIHLQTRLGAGVLFPKDDNALVDMTANAAMGILSAR